MYCPISFASHGYYKKCEKENCAWWNEIQKCCAVVNIAIAINNLWVNRRISKTVKKFPHLWQQLIDLELSEVVQTDIQPQPE